MLKGCEDSNRFYFLYTLGHGGLDGGNGLCYKVRPSPSFSSFLNFFDCRKGQLFVFLKIDVNSGTLFCFSLWASNCLGARSIVPFLWT